MDNAKVAGVLVDRAPVEAAHADPHAGRSASRRARAGRSTAGCAAPSGTSAARMPLADVGHRVERGDTWNQRQLVQRGPRVLAAAGEQQRREHEREDDVDAVRHTSVPSTSPRPAPSSAAEQDAATSSGTPAPAPGDRAEDEDPHGDHDRASRSARGARRTATFSAATSPVAIGASRRSSISFVQPNSTTSGNASVCMPVITAVSASSPGNSRSA